MESIERGETERESVSRIREIPVDEPRTPHRRPAAVWKIPADEAADVTVQAGQLLFEVDDP